MDMDNGLNLKRPQDSDADAVTSLEPEKKKSKVDDICGDHNVTDTSAGDASVEREERVENSTDKNEGPVGNDQKVDKTSSKSSDEKSEDGHGPESEPMSNVASTTTDAGIASSEVTTSPNTAGQDVGKVNTSLLQSEGSGRVTEVDVGITEYLGSHSQSFSAVIKQRYSDFIVNEIDEDGNVVHLTSVTYDEKDDSKEKEEDEEDKKAGGEEETSVVSEADMAAIQKLVTDRNRDATHEILAPDDKDARTKIHLAVKRNFPTMETKTGENKGGKKVIEVTWRKGKTRDAVRDEWPKSKKSCRYVRFVLYKENKDTMDAIGLIAKNLKVKESMFQYAGTKDRRAKTAQEITAHRIHPKKLSSLNKVLWNMGLGDFRYVQQPLQLGQLSGNRFVIVLRNVQEGREVVDSSLTSLKDTGFINYFGMQRFGTTSIPTHEIGSNLLKGNWDKAIDLILAPRNDLPAKDKFQKMWAATRDPAATLDVTPRFCGLERNILLALKKNAKPFYALEKLPRNTRVLYLHSYQSLVWNKMASKRLTQLGHCVVAGDLVMDRKTCSSDGQEKPSPTVVTEENAKDYTLSDVVLPLPGYDVIYPQNKIGAEYRETLTNDGLDIDNMKRPQKDYSLSGAYRHLVVMPKDVSWTHHRYDDYTQPLTLSDLDRLQGETLVNSGETGKMSAVVLSLSLPSSCYATMALREAMRVDTSSFHQASLNVTSWHTLSMTS